MRKFECTKCYKKCQTMVIIEPKFCLLFGDKADWHEVKEVDSAENERFGNSEQLPDWVKVGEPVYNIKEKQYQTISRINSTVMCENIDSEGCTLYGYGAFMSDCVEARKRPFNPDEMKALVARFIEIEEQIAMVMGYNKSSNRILIWGSTFLSAKQLINLEVTIDGKPCYKLEHLNEKGEWVG